MWTLGLVGLLLELKDHLRSVCYIHIPSQLHLSMPFMEVMSN